MFKGNSELVRTSQWNPHRTLPKDYEALHVLLHAFKLSELEGLMLHCLESGHGGQILALLLRDLMLLLCNSCSRCPPEKPWPSSPRIFNMMIYHHIYLFHNIFCCSSFKDLLILMVITAKAISISSSCFLFSSFCKTLMNCLVKSSCSCFFKVIFVGGLEVSPSSLTEVILAFLDEFVASSLPPFPALQCHLQPPQPLHLHPHSSTGLAASAAAPLFFMLPWVLENNFKL